MDLPSLVAGPPGKAAQGLRNHSERDALARRARAPPCVLATRCRSVRPDRHHRERSPGRRPLPWGDRISVTRSLALDIREIDLLPLVFEFFESSFVPIFAVLLNRAYRTRCASSEGPSFVAQIQFLEGAVVAGGGTSGVPLTCEPVKLGETTYPSVSSQPFDLIGRWQIPSKQILEQELGTCRELLQELEDGPEYKWPLLALVYIRYALDPVAYMTDIFADIAKLMEIDADRRGYYADLRSRFTVEYNICAAPHGFPSGACELPGAQLSYFPHVDRFVAVRALDLSRNQIVSLALFSSLVNLEELNVDENAIEEITPNDLHGLHKLQTLSVRANKIGAVSSLLAITKGAPNLRTLRASGNPFSLEGLDVASLFGTLALA
eukprot:m.330477 g.330477  ORF g.330477 m.330477 type:complete len:379 (-) comp55609_c0_seq7:153-1289(-)